MRRSRESVETKFDEAMDDDFNTADALAAIFELVKFVTVEVTPDLKYCKAYISVLGSDEAAKAVVEGLRSAVGYIRKELARRVNLRNTPEIKFILDQSIEYGVNMSRLIVDVTKDLKDDEEE